MNCDPGRSHAIQVGQWIPVEPTHCHQRFPENALISHVRALSEDGVFTELRCKYEREKLPFFYDHEIDHLPGMLEACTLRQTSLVVAHLIYGVPMDYVALLEWMRLKLYNYGEIDTPTTAKLKLVSVARTAHKLEYTLAGMMIQKDYPVMSARGKLVMLSPQLAKRLRHKKIPLKLFVGSGLGERDVATILGEPNVAPTNH